MKYLIKNINFSKSNLLYLVIKKKKKGVKVKILILRDKVQINLN